MTIPIEPQRPQLMQNDPFSKPGYTDNFYDAVGGHDTFVKLIDVYPDDYPNPEPNPTGVQMSGYQQLVRGEPLRGKFRNSFEKPEPFVPGKMTEVNFNMPDINHTFRRGHRIMVQVQSSWFPLVDRNPQKFVDIYHAHEGDFQSAVQRVYRSGKLSSRVVLPILP